MNPHPFNTAQQYDPEPFIEAVTAQDWSDDHVGVATRAMQATALSQLGIAWGEEEAQTEIFRLVNLNLIKVEPDRPANNLAETGKLSPPIKGKYFRVLPDE